MSRAVSTAWTPGIASAAAVSIPRMRACGCGLRTKAPCSMPASLMSSTKRARPVRSAGSSTRATRAPNCFAPILVLRFVLARDIIEKRDDLYQALRLAENDRRVAPPAGRC